jgi:uncharacterized membrane protein
MSALDQPVPAVSQAIPRQRSSRPRPTPNVGRRERATSVATGSVLTLLGLARRSIPGLLIASAGAALLRRGASGHCRVYEALGIDTHRSRRTGIERPATERGAHVEQALLINRSPEELYGFWRSFANLPQIMSHLERVEVHDERRSHWVAKASAAGRGIEWDAEITRDEPNHLIAWRSLPGSDIDCVGEVRFGPTIGDRGTEVHISMDYAPPAGRIGHGLATLVGASPRRQMREDLRSFKQRMEIGEVLSTEGQPRGTCLDGGKRERQ